jgi:hypothetical protein
MSAQSTLKSTKEQQVLFPEVGKVTEHEQE